MWAVLTEKYFACCTKFVELPMAFYGEERRRGRSADVKN
jgi:hypothetical protein